MVIFIFNQTILNLNHTSSFDWQGHRGCRGLMPENTIPAFLHALSLGVTTLEIDVVITQDHQVVVSHEPYLNHELCEQCYGRKITAENEKDFNIYLMSYARLSQCDCGSKPHARFPSQENFVATKPLLSAVFKAVEAFSKTHKISPCLFNIEIKSTPETDDIFHPQFKQYTDLLVEEVTKHNVLERLTIQSFDVRPLQYLHQYFPFIPLSYLIENNLSFSENITTLGFNPSTYSPDFGLVSAQLIADCEANNMLVIPWTVNEIADMKHLIKLGVHGLISDYPDRFTQLF